MRNAARLTAAIALAIGAASPASAVDWVITVHVQAVEATYMPERIVFWVDGAAGTCVPGQEFGPSLSWTAKGSTAEKAAANAQAIFSLLMTARASGRPVKLFGRNSDCEVEYIYLK